jgi:hypothetical protein
VISSAVPATFIANERLTFWPVVTITSRFTVVKPAIVTVSLYVPGSRFRKRKSPCLSDWVVRPPMLTLFKATLTPGSTAPEASRTEP